MNEDELDPIQSAFVDAMNTSTPDDQLKILAFAAGVDVEQAIINVAYNVSEDTLRQVFATTLLGMFDAGRVEVVLEIVRTAAAIERKRGII